MPRKSAPAVDQPAPSSRISPAQLRLLADPVREHILQSLVVEAKTATQLAAELGCAPARLYHHLKRLQDEGLLRVERELPVRGVTERHYRATARTLKLDRQAFVQSGSGLDAIGDYVFAQTRSELEDAVRGGQLDLAAEYPDPRAVLAWRSVVRVDHATATRLQQTIRALYDELDALAQQRRPDGDLFSFAVALVPCDPARQRVRRTPRPRSETL